MVVMIKIKMEMEMEMKMKMKMKIFEPQKSKNLVSYANISNMLFDQKSQVQSKVGLPRGYRHPDKKKYIFSFQYNFLFYLVKNLYYYKCS